MHSSKSVGDYIREARGALTLKAFAELLNSRPPDNVIITIKDLSKYENGTTMPPADKYIKIITLGAQLNEHTS